MQEDSRRTSSTFRTHEGECHTIASAAGAEELDHQIGAPRHPNRAHHRGRRYISSPAPEYFLRMLRQHDADFASDVQREGREQMKQLTVWVFVAMVLFPAPLMAQVNPVNDFSGGLSLFTIGDDAAGPRHTAIGWQASASQKIKSAVEATKKDTPISIVGDFGGQFWTSDDGSHQHAYEYMGGVRARAGSLKQRTSVFAHALFGGTTRGDDLTSATGFMMGYGGGLDLVSHPSGPAYDLGLRIQFDWLPSRVNGAWTEKQFRIGVGVVFMVRYWD